MRKLEASARRLKPSKTPSATPVCVEAPPGKGTARWPKWAGGDVDSVLSQSTAAAADSQAETVSKNRVSRGSLAVHVTGQCVVVPLSAALVAKPIAAELSCLRVSVYAAAPSSQPHCCKCSLVSVSMFCKNLMLAFFGTDVPSTIFTMLALSVRISACTGFSQVRAIGKRCHSVMGRRGRVICRRSWYPRASWSAPELRGKTKGLFGPRRC